MFGIGLGLGFSRRRGTATPSLLPIGSQILFYGDGVFSENACPGLRCTSLWALIYLKGRVFPSPAWMQCGSGGDMDTIYARRASAIGQQADIPVFTSQGHNDLLMGTDPDVDATQWNKWTRNLDAWIAGNTTAGLIPVCTTIKSTVASESTIASVGVITRAQRVNQLQLAYIATKAALDSRIIAIDTFAVYDPANMSSDPTNNTHPDKRGGYALGFGTIGPAIDPYVTAKTKDEILDLMRANTYPGLTGTNFDTDVLLQGGTGGTKSGTVAPTGSYPTGKRITNNLTNGTSVAVACSIDSSNPNYSKAVIAVSGTPAAEGTIVQDDTGAIAATGTTPAQYAAAAWGVTIDDGAGAAPTGFQSLLAAYGSFGSVGSSANDGTSLTLTHAIDTVLIAAPKPLFLSSGPLSANPALTTRWTATALTGRVQMSRPTLHTVSTPTRSAPAYIGADTILSPNYQLRVTGTISQAAGGTLRLEPGAWAPYGLTEAHFTYRAFWKGAIVTGSTSGNVLTVTAILGGATLRVGDQVMFPNEVTGFAAVGTISSFRPGTTGGLGTYNVTGLTNFSSQTVYCGSQLGSNLSGSTWTQLSAASAVTTGDIVWADLIADNGLAAPRAFSTLANSITAT
jgi:hypothetical protein